MNKQALFCDGTARYVCPLEPEVGETVTLKFRAAKEDNIQIRLAINNELYTMESGTHLWCVHLLPGRMETERWDDFLLF